MRLMGVAAHLDAEVADVVLHETDGGRDARVARGFVLAGFVRELASPRREERSSRRNIASAHAPPRCHDANSVTWIDSHGSYHDGSVVLDVEGEATSRRSHVRTCSAPSHGDGRIGAAPCSGRPAGQTRRWRMRRVGHAELRSKLVGVASAEERIRAVEGPGVVDHVAGADVLEEDSSAVRSPS